MEYIIKKIVTLNFSAIEIIAILLVVTICLISYNYFKKKYSDSGKCINNACLQNALSSLKERDKNIKLIICKLESSNAQINELLKETKKNNKILQLSLLEGINEDEKRSILHILNEQ